MFHYNCSCQSWLERQVRGYGSSSDIGSKANVVHFNGLFRAELVEHKLEPGIHLGLVLIFLTYQQRF